MTIAIPRLDRSTAAERGITLADFLVPVAVAERTDPHPPRRAGRHRRVRGRAVGPGRDPDPASVPFTGQTFGVLVVGGALGFRRGALALLLYLAMGLAGLSVFAEGTSGVAKILGRAAAT